MLLQGFVQNGIMQIAHKKSPGIAGAFLAFDLTNF
jgi:hypothetical protein